jgi:hypothetical protein
LLLIGSIAAPSGGGGVLSNEKVHRAIVLFIYKSMFCYLSD